MNSIKKLLSPIILGLTTLLTGIGIYLLKSAGEDKLQLQDNAELLFITLYILAGLAVFGVVLGFVITVVTNPKSVIRVGISIGALLIIGLIAYSMADPTVYEKLPVSERISKLMGAGLILTEILGILALCSWIYAEVSRLFK